MGTGFYKIDDTIKDVSKKVVFNRSLRKSDIPEDQLLLKRQYDDSCMTLKSISSDNEDTYLNKLMEIVVDGLVGINGTNEVDTTKALLDLEKYKREIAINEGKIIKEKYMIDLGYWVLKIGFFPLLLIYAIQLEIKELDILKYILVWAGCMAGTWISYGARRVSKDFNELHLSKTDNLSSPLKLIFISSSTIFLFLFADAGLMKLVFGDVRGETLLDENNLFIFGGLCGLLDSKIASTLYQKADSSFKF